MCWELSQLQATQQGVDTLILTGDMNAAACSMSMWGTGGENAYQRDDRV